MADPSPLSGMVGALARGLVDHPEIINGSRRRRIASGSGTSVQEVNQLLSQFKQMRKLMKQMGRGGLPALLGR